MYVLKRNLVSFFAVLAMVIAPLTVQAAAQRPYNEQAFKAAQEAGNPVLIEIHADWCPTCKAQLPILNKLSGEPAYSGIERLRVDFDSQKNVVKRFKATTQSTLVLYKGKIEVARSVGETDEGRIRAMLDKAR
jgi:thiol-disulfide isomerase/thioredoxin